MRIEELFDHPQALPSAPKVVADLIASFNEEDVSIDDVAKRIAADPALSARVLRLANSAMWSQGRALSTINEALMMLGFMAVRTVVISVGLVGGFKPMPGVDYAAFWRYSLQTAAAARWIARFAKINSDEAYTIGVMHAIGHLVMCSAMGDKMAQVESVVTIYSPERSMREVEAFGFDFAAVGAELARRWHLPEVFAESLLQFGRPRSQVAAAVALGAWRAREAMGGVESAQQLADSISLEHCAILGVDAGALLAEIPSMGELSAGIEAFLA